MLSSCALISTAMNSVLSAARRLGVDPRLVAALAVAARTTSIVSGDFRPPEAVRGTRLAAYDDIQRVDYSPLCTTVKLTSLATGSVMPVVISYCSAGILSVSYGR